MLHAVIRILTLGFYRRPTVSTTVVTNYSIAQIPNPMVQREAVAIPYSQGRINEAVKVESMALIVSHAKRRGIKDMRDVLCAVCAWPIIDKDADLDTAVIIVQRIEPHGYLRHTPDLHCETEDTMPSVTA